MAVRLIEYIVKKNGIEPATKKFGGLQGEHNATKLLFSFEEELLSELLLLSNDGELMYRFDAINAEGRKKSTEPYLLEFKDSEEDGISHSMEYPLEEWLTRFPGIIKVVLAVAHICENKTEMELYSFPVAIEIKPTPDGKESKEENRESITSLAEIAKNAANECKESADLSQWAKELAEQACNRTEEAQRTLEEDSTLVIRGGKADSRFNVDLIVDEQLLENSKNPIANSAVYAELQKNSEYINAELQKNADYIDTKFQKFADYIVEQGISGIWSYRKWESGLAECWGRYIGESTKTLTTWGNLFIAPVNTKRIPYPFPFIAIPVETARVFDNSEYLACFGYAQSKGGNTFTESGIYNFARGADKTSSEINILPGIDLHVIGRWK